MAHESYSVLLFRESLHLLSLHVKLIIPFSLGVDIPTPIQVVNPRVNTRVVRVFVEQGLIPLFQPRISIHHRDPTADVL